MTQTVLSSTSTYCTATQLLRLIDWRTMADFLSDTGERLADATAVANSTNLAKILMAASGQVESVALVGGRYTPTDLRAIADAATPTNATELLAEIVAGLALWRVLRRRPDPNRPKPEMTKDSEEWLKRLAAGEALFPTEESAAAGVPDSIMETREHVETRWPLTALSDRLFGDRTDRTWNE